VKPARLRRTFIPRAPHLTSPASQPLKALVPLLVAASLSCAFAADVVRPLPHAAGGRTGFTRLSPADTGVRCTNVLTGFAAAQNRILENGSGIALGDVDGDGLVDIYVCRLEGGNVLYKNLGNWKFQDVTESAGAACLGQASTAAVLADLDGDGDLDLLVNCIGGGTREFLNDGAGHFQENLQSHLARRFCAMSMALADMDGDGDLDLYVANYRTTTYKDDPPGLKIEVKQDPDGSLVVEPRDRFISLKQIGNGVEFVERGERHFLYLNQGGGRFDSVAWDHGAFLDEDGAPLKAPFTDWGLSVMFRDLNGDGWPDIYVCNDFVYWPDRIWISEGGRRFRAAPRTAFRHQPLSSMAVDVADIDRDGHDDIFVSEMMNPSAEFRAWQRPNTMAEFIHWPVEDPLFRPSVTRNTLQWNRGDNTYAEIAPFAGLPATGWSWGSIFLDVDLDGWEDLLITAGNLHDVQDADVLAGLKKEARPATPGGRAAHWARFAPLTNPKKAFRNRRDRTFEDVSAAWGFADAGIGNGMALADLDGDGDLDVVVNELNGAPSIYRNETAAPRVAVRLNGVAPNTRGIGARIRVTGGPVDQEQEMICGGRYLSCDDAMRVFAAGGSTNLTVSVVWRSGRRSTVTNVPPNSLVVVDEASATASPRTPPAASPTAPTPLFADVSAGLGAKHNPTPFDDFARQPLLPHRLSTFSPGAVWVASTNGGVELLQGNGRDTGVLGYARRDGRWAPDLETPGRGGQPGRVTGVVSWRIEHELLRVAAGISTWETDDASAPAARVWTEGAGWTDLAHSSASTGPLAAADVDGDGRPDLFVGGMAIPGRWPEPADSVLWTWGADGKPAVLQVFKDLGLANAALFADLNGDGRPDLVVATEWGPVRVFLNESGKLVEATDRLGLAQRTGWWLGVAAGDFDGDGRTDLVVGNWGSNGQAAERGARSASVTFADFTHAGRVDPLVGSLDAASGRVMAWRERGVVAAALPFLAETAPDYHAYGAASVAKLIVGHEAGAKTLEAVGFESVVLLNRGDHFDARPLPYPAQLAPAVGVAVADFDGDGRDDIALSQNFFGVDPESARLDAGVGLILLGNGDGTFRSASPDQSGVRAWGEGRGLAVADFDGDGRPDLAMAQFGGPTLLFHNQGGKPGATIRLRGGPTNPDALGAAVRLRFPSGWGPVHERRAGGGWWSQDGPDLLFGAPEAPVEVRVRWPGGAVQTLPWPAGTGQITLTQPGG
jgi:enediyne biosynthesis protein E4